MSLAMSVRVSVPVSAVCCLLCGLYVDVGVRSLHRHEIHIQEPHTCHMLQPHPHPQPQSHHQSHAHVHDSRVHVATHSYKHNTCIMMHANPWLPFLVRSLSFLLLFYIVCPSLSMQALSCHSLFLLLLLFSLLSPSHSSLSCLSFLLPLRGRCFSCRAPDPCCTVVCGGIR